MYETNRKHTKGVGNLHNSRIQKESLNDKYNSKNISTWGKYFGKEIKT